MSTAASQSAGTAGHAPMTVRPATKKVSAMVTIRRGPSRSGSVAPKSRITSDTNE